MPVGRVDMQGKICLVTGANSGIGKATALGLAEMGAVVVMVCRDRARGVAARDEIQTASGNDSVELLVADLASLENVSLNTHKLVSLPGSSSRGVLGLKL